MGQTRNVARGFIASASAIWLFTCLWISAQISVLLGTGIFLFLLIPFSIRAFLYVKSINEKATAQIRVKQAKNALMSLQGVGFACWFLDVTSTVFVVDIKQSAAELNILGWPYAALGGLAYYIPITLATYYLLFKVKSKESFYATTVITAVTLFMGLLNLNAGLHNLGRVGKFTSSTDDFIILGIWLAVALILSALNIVAIIKTGRDARAQKKVQAS